MVAPITPSQNGGKINDDVKGSATIRDGRIYTSDIADKQVTMEKLADEVTESLLPAVTADDKDMVPVVNEDGEWELGAGGGGGSGGETTFEFTMYGDSEAASSYGTARAYSTDEVTFAELKAAWEANSKIIITLWWDREYGAPEMKVTVNTHKLVGSGTEMFGIVFPAGNDIKWGAIEDWGTKIAFGCYSLSDTGD